MKMKVIITVPALSSIDHWRYDALISNNVNTTNKISTFPSKTIVFANYTTTNVQIYEKLNA